MGGGRFRDARCGGPELGTPDALDDDRWRLLVPASPRAGLEALRWARVNLDPTRGDALLHRLTALEDLLAVALGKDGHDGVLLDDGVQRLAELGHGDQGLRLAEHRIEGADGPTAIFGVSQGDIQAVAQRFVVFFGPRGHQLAEPLNSAVRDAVASVADERGAHAGACSPQASRWLPPRMLGRSRWIAGVQPPALGDCYALPVRAGSRFRRYFMGLAFAGLAFATLGLTTSAARAAGVRGSGAAKVSEWKQAPSSTTLRARAIRRARLAALQAAMDGLEGRVDKDAKKSVQREGTRWTGAYRIVSEQVDPQGVRVELEVEIDLARLAKFVAPAAAPSPAKVRFHLGERSAGRGCTVEAEQVADDLVRLGVAKAQVGSSVPVAVVLECESLGPVPNTLLKAVRVRVEAKAAGRLLLKSDEAAFGVDELSARERGAGAVADALAAEIMGDPGGVVLRVESPHPASRVRRLQRALADRVSGVRKANLVGIDPDGSVLIELVSKASAQDIARRLEALGLPDFEVTVVSVHDARTLSVRLR